MKTLLKDSNGGIGIALSVAFMAFSLVLISGALTLASTLARDSGVKTRLMKSQYSLLGGVEYGFDRLTNASGFLSSLGPLGQATETISLNGLPVQVTTQATSSAFVEPPPGFPPPDAAASRRIQTLKTVSPTTAAPFVSTIFSYTITIENRDSTLQGVTSIRDCLPPGFVYVPLSTSGITNIEPSISTNGTTCEFGHFLNWNVSGLGINMAPGQSISLSFRAVASVATGNYCNEAWATPGADKTSSRETALIRVGTPPNDLCQGAALEILQSVTPSLVDADEPEVFTYTVRLHNYGSVPVTIDPIRNLLPASFNYVPASTSGDFTTNDPQIALQDDRYRLQWNLPNSTSVPSGETRQLVFQASSTPEPGVYWNEVWAATGEFEHDIYSWPGAPVRTVRRFELTVTQGGQTYSAIIWSDGLIVYVTEWQIAG